MYSPDKKITRLKVHGWINLDKPLEMTSTQAIGKVRRLLGGKKVGHGGTLDPLATGVLPLAFGEATKLIPYAMDGAKSYNFTVRWGEQRTTDDAEGEVMATSEKRPTEKALREALQNFIGYIQQKPPTFSAIKVDGARAYDMARAGKPPDLPSREVFVENLEIINVIEEEATLKLDCGKGTYVRALARDLALFLGTYGYVTYLRRTKVGTFDIKDSISLEKLEDLAHNEAAITALLPIEAALDDIPGLTLDGSEAQRLRQGQSLLIRPQHLSLLEAPVILATYEGEPVALVKAEEGTFKVMRGFSF